MKPDRSVTFCLPNGFGVGGVETWSVQLCRHLANSGFDARLLVHRNTCYAAPCPAQDSLDFRYIHDDHRTSFVRSGVLDIYASTLPTILVPNWDDHVYATAAKLVNRYPERVRVLGFCHTDESYYYELLRYYEPAIHRFVAVSQTCLRKLQEVLPHRQTDILFKAYPVLRPDRTRLKLDKNPDPIKIVFAGRIQQFQKRVLDIFFIARRLIEMKVPFRLYLVGDGVDKELLLHKFGTLHEGQEYRVEFLPPQSHENFLNLLMDMDISVLTSEFEGTSIFMLESMAHGCVPIVTSVSGTEMIRNGYNGFKVDVGDYMEMAAHVRRLHADPEWMKNVKRNAYDTVGAYAMEEYLAWFKGLSRDVWNAKCEKWPIFKPYVRLQSSAVVRKLNLPAGAIKALVKRLLALDFSQKNTKKNLGR